MFAFKFVGGKLNEYTVVITNIITSSESYVCFKEMLSGPIKVPGNTETDPNIKHSSSLHHVNTRAYRWVGSKPLDKA